MLPEGLGVELSEDKWEVPAIFNVMEKVGNLDRIEMYNIFNMGTGMVLAVDETVADEVVKFFNENGEKAYTIGVVTDQPGVVEIHLK